MFLNEPRLQDVLRIRDWNFAELARVTGYSEAYISKVRKRVARPSSRFMEVLAITTGLNLSDLFIIEPEKEHAVS